MNRLIVLKPFSSIISLTTCLLADASLKWKVYNGIHFPLAFLGKHSSDLRTQARRKDRSHRSETPGRKFWPKKNPGWRTKITDSNRNCSSYNSSGCVRVPPFLMNKNGKSQSSRTGSLCHCCSPLVWAHTFSRMCVLGLPSFYSPGPCLLWATDLLNFGFSLQWPMPEMWE